MLYVAAGCLVVVGLPMMAVAHRVVAERMDKYQQKHTSEDMESRARQMSVGSNAHRERSTSMSAALPSRLFGSHADRDAAFASIDSSQSNDAKRVALLAACDDLSYDGSREHRILTIDLTNDASPQQESGTTGASGQSDTQGYDLSRDMSGKVSGTSLSRGHEVDESSEPSYGWSMKVTSFAINSLHKGGLVRFHDEE